MLSLLQLKYFLALAKQPNMTKVSTELFISQTALSNAISRLEKELGVQLFDRIGRNIILNEYGKTYLQYVNNAFNELSFGRKSINNLKNKQKSNVSILTSSSVLWYNMLSQFVDHYPGYTFSQQECVLENIRNSLPMFNADYIITGLGDLNSPKLENVVFRKANVYLHVPLSHRLANRKKISLIEAKNESFINYPKGTSFRMFCDNLFKQAGFVPKIIAECDYNMRRELFDKNMGVILITEAALDINYYDQGINLLIDYPPTKRSYALYWSRDNIHTKATEDFRHFVVNYFNNKNFMD